MGSFTKGDIVLYPFPYTDLTGQKLRPCLILSKEMKKDILLCQITSQNVSSDEFSINLNKNETLNGSLMINSLIRCNMLFTGDKTDVKRIICKLSSKKYEEVCKKINQIISK